MLHTPAELTPAPGGAVSGGRIARLGCTTTQRRAPSASPPCC
jgi:hypothetical protein